MSAGVALLLSCMTTTASCLPPPPGLVGWWRGEGDASDSAGTNGGVLQGGAAFDLGEVGQAFSLNGTNAYVQVPDSDLWAFGSSDFSIEFWVNLRFINPFSTITEPAVVFIGNDEGRYTVNKWFFALGDSRLYFHVNGPETGSFFLVQAPFSPATNRWYHLAVVRKGDVFTVYRDGVAIGAETNAVTVPNPNAPLTIGEAEGNYFLNGLIDEVSVYRYALTAADIQGIYEAGPSGKCPAVPPCAPVPAGLLGWWRGESNALDSVGANNGALVNGASFSAGEVGQAFSFSGAGQYVKIPGSAELDPGSQVTVEFWMRADPDNAMDTIQGLVASDFYDVGIWPGRSFSERFGIDFGISTDSGQYFSMIADANGGGAPVTPGVWHHVAATYDGAQIELYIDGRLWGNPVPATGRISPMLPTSSVSLGSEDGRTYCPQCVRNRYFKGRIDEVDIFDRALSADEIHALYAAGVAGKCAGPTPPRIFVQPANQQVVAGDDASFTVVAGGTPPPGYQWMLNGAEIAGATDPSLTLTDVQLSQAGSYAVTVSNSVGSVTSSNAVLNVNFPPALVRASDAAGVAGAVVGVPVFLVANGNENALGFSLNFDPALVSYSSASLGTGARGGSLLINTNLAASGKLGVALSLPANSIFAPGTQEVAVINLALGIRPNSIQTPISFGDVPILRQISDSKAQVLPATYAGGTLTITGASFEGDVAPRPNGDQAVTITDWVLEGRYVARLDYPTNASEFRRADCAPRSSLGDGVINVSDWVQVGRYAAGMDPLTVAGGPDALGGQAVPVPQKADTGTRRVVITNSMLLGNQTGTVSVDLDAQGDENALSFSLAFDPKALAYTGASLGAADAGGTLNINATEAASGHVAFVLALPIGQQFAAGTQEILRVNFRAVTAASVSSPVEFSDQPVPRGISDINASTLTAQYVGASVAVNPLPSLGIGVSGQRLELSWPLWATNFSLQQAAGVMSPSSVWTNVMANPILTNNQEILSLPVPTTNMFYRLQQP